MSENDWIVEIDSSGRAGSIYYKEGSNIIQFSFEIGGKFVAAIWPPDKQVWDSKFAWAIGRRKEIIDRLIQEVIRQKAPSSVAEEDERYNIIYLK